MVIVAPVVLTVVIVARIAEQPDSYITWGVFAALVVSGITTVLQAIRVGRVGAGHVLIMGTSGAFIAVCVAAMVEGGPSLMATLIIISALFQFALAARLSLLRRIFTPVVSGTVVMLIAATVMPIVFDTMTAVPENTSGAAAPVAAAATLVTVAVLVLRAPPAWRLWSADHRHRRRMRGWRPLRPLRGPAGGGCSLGWRPRKLLARHRRHAGNRVLGALAGLRGRDHRRSGGDHRRWHRHPARLAPSPPGHRLSCRPGSPQRRRRGELPFRAPRHAPEHHLLLQHLNCRGNRRRGPTRGRRHRHLLRGDRLLSEDRGAPHRHSRPRRRRLHNGPDRAPVRAGDATHHPRRRRPPESARGGRGLPGSARAFRTSGSSPT